MWEDPRFCQQPEGAQLLYLWLASHRGRLHTIDGVTVGGPATVAELREVQTRTIKRYLKSLQDAGLVETDMKRIIWLPEFTRVGAPASEDHLLGCLRALANVPKRDLQRTITRFLCNLVHPDWFVPSNAPTDKSRESRRLCAAQRAEILEGSPAPHGVHIWE